MVVIDYGKGNMNSKQYYIRTSTNTPFLSYFDKVSKIWVLLCTLTRWTIASVKNTRSMPAPRMLSLYKSRNMFSLSHRSLKETMGSYTFGMSKLVSSGSSPAQTQFTIVETV